MTKLNFTPAVNIIVQGPFKGDTAAKAADALALGVKTACSRYAWSASGRRATGSSGS